MAIDGGLYRFTIPVPLNSTDSLSYFITALDTSDMLNSTETRTIKVMDNISPEVQPVDNITLYKGDILNISINATDNVGITEYIWNNTPVPSSGSTLSGISSEPGNFEVTFTVYDKSGNYASISFTITILPVDNDNDGDGIPDLVEKANGLDMNSPADAFLDPDNDGLINLEEYINGTNMNDDDSDRDEMPDGWEIDNGLDALTPSADNDADGDGKTDLEEYNDGTDPNVKEESGESSNSWIVVLILLVLVLIFLIGFSMFFFLRRKKNVKEPQLFSENEVGSIESQLMKDSTQEYNDNLEHSGNELSADIMESDDVDVQIQEIPFEHPQWYNEGIPGQVVSEPDQDQLEKTPTDEQRINDVPSNGNSLDQAS